MEKPTEPVAEPENTESSVAPAPPERRRFTLAINQTVQEWLQRRNLSEHDSFYKEDSSETSDDDSEVGVDTKEKTHKVRKFFKSLFNSEVTKEKIPDSIAEPEVAAPGGPAATESADIPLAPVAVALETATPEPTAESETVPPADPEQAPEPPQNEVIAPVEVPLDLAVAAHFEQTQREAIVTAQDMEDEDEKEVEISLGRQWHRGGHTSSQVETAIHQSEVRRNRAERKQNHEVEETKKRVKKLEKAQKQSEKQSVVELTTEKAPQPPRTPEKVISTAPVEKKPEQKMEQKRTPEQEPQSVKEILAQRKIERTPEKTVEPQELPRATYESMRPETVQKQVEKAAEEDIAIEGLFERSHETKDIDSAMQAVGSGGTTTGRVTLTAEVPLSATQFSMPTQTQSLQPSIDDTPPLLRPEYKQAAQHGFWAAIVLLLLAGMLAFIR